MVSFGRNTEKYLVHTFNLTQAPLMNKWKMSTRTIYRRSDKGTITTQKYAENHPRTTEKERVHVPSRKK